MSEKIHTLPKAKIQQDALSWFFWTLPVGAALLCAWFLLHDFVFAGPTITIYFQNADGLQEQNSMVKYRGIDIGEVETLRLDDKDQNVIVRAKLYRTARNVARQGAAFWIVRPELKLGEISGLQTIVSGSYVAVQPGTGDATNVFTGVTEEPVTPLPGIVITLLSDDLDSIENQSKIFYRGIQVGEVTDFRLGDDARYVIMHARILKNYAPVVRTDSQFWNAGGISAHLGLFSGLNISAESANTLLSGGLAFVTPDHYGPPATNGTVFYINPKEDPAWENWNPTITPKIAPEEKGAKTP